MLLLWGWMMLRDSSRHRGSSHHILMLLLLLLQEGLCRSVGWLKAVTRWNSLDWWLADWCRILVDISEPSIGRAGTHARVMTHWWAIWAHDSTVG